MTVNELIEELLKLGPTALKQEVEFQDTECEGAGSVQEVWQMSDRVVLRS